MPLTRGTAVVCGALSIIGVAYAGHLARKGYDLVLIDGHRPRLNALAQELTTSTRRAVEVVVLSRRSLLDVAAVKAQIHQDASIVLVVDIADENGHASLSARQANALIGVFDRDGAVTDAAVRKFSSLGVGISVYRAGVVITAPGGIDDFPGLFQNCDFE
ncbi:hypothetical protein [Paraburkholderia hospita]|jgi:NAD(P)-dependent dehydrogenase (short-subunit alcohol dehydrogenase family)|uniref:hypothetical protein n=1 Tax=Paraburkholderia hospita TaxID=169430 RepID=UPI000B3418DB|nr:hypothetical protein [Paraburkholderia hospita]OUL68176.1 hypothetical protein CA601_52030 [Paraburkholderia hospita]